jgi:hypothetical protein
MFDPKMNKISLPMNTNSDALHRRILVIDDNQAIHQDFQKIFSGRSDDETALS